MLTRVRLPLSTKTKKKKKNTEPLSKLFFAYQGARNGSCDDNVEAIKRGIKDYNNYQKACRATSWEDLKQSGGIIDKEILKEIRDSNYFACDLTYFNHNVLFELGYAIALRKQIYIFLNEDIKGAKETYTNSFLKTVKYSSFKNAKDIIQKFHNKEYSDEHIKKIINLDNLEEENDIFYLENQSESQISLDLNSFIDSLRTNPKYTLKIVSFDPYEVSYQTLNYYFTNLFKAKSIIFHMTPKNYENEFQENAKKSFLAGISCGLNKKVLLVAPTDFNSPLDYADILINYANSEDCRNKVSQWIKKHCTKSKNENNTNADVTVKEEIKQKEINLINILKVALECTAENEKNELSQYFISTNAYEKAKENKSKLILVGRKGAGKTAIYLKLQEDLAENNLNYVVSLKPDSLELLDNIDMSTLFKKGSSRKRFFYGVWKTVIYSKLIDVINSRLLIKSQSSFLDENEKEIRKFYKENEYLIKQNFYGIIKELNKNNSNKLDSPQILEDLYTTYLTPLINLLNRYFADKKYVKIHILSDNLDKSWNPETNLKLQSDMIFSLLEVDSILKNELRNKTKEMVNIYNYLFLREDIYNYILTQANEPDKLTTISYKIIWDDAPLKLKQLVELKFKHILNKDNDYDNNKFWTDLFDMKKGNDAFENIKNIIVLRPRDIIYFIQALFESAANNNKEKVSFDDFYYAINKYTQFLNGNLISEMQAEYPNIRQVLNLFQMYGQLKYKNYRNHLQKLGYEDKSIEDLTKSLFSYGYLQAFDNTDKTVCGTFDDLQMALNKRQLLFIKHNVILFVNRTYQNVNPNFFMYFKHFMT